MKFWRKIVCYTKNKKGLKPNLKKNKKQKQWSVEANAKMTGALGLSGKTLNNSP